MKKGGAEVPSAGSRGRLGEGEGRGGLRPGEVMRGGVRALGGGEVRAAGTKALICHRYHAL